MARIESWRFTVTASTGEVVKIVTVQAKRQGDVLGALTKLNAPMAAVKLLQTRGLGSIRRFNWDTPLARVVGTRI